MTISMTSDAGSPEKALALASARQADAMDRLFQILRIPSISTDPAHADDCKRAADWCVAQLAELGFEARRHDTAGQPMVVGRRLGANSQGGASAQGGAGAQEGADERPHVLFYGHYDVQPADPLEQWERDPFDPAIVEDVANGPVIVARGASDDKGQFMTFLEACRALIDADGGLPVDVTVLLEGEEESGSPSLPAFIAEHGNALKADLVLVCDTGQWDRETPAITTMLRGMSFCEVILTGPNRDLHSGMFGGPALNPIRVLTDILGDLYDAEGRVQIAGFYDGISELPAAVKQTWAELGGDGSRMLGPIGLTQPAGESGRSVLEQVWSRPTAEVNGIIGGYTGPGTKTVIPSEASAKLSFRLVPGQDPDKVVAGFKAFVTKRLPGDCKVRFIGDRGSPAVGFDLNSKAMEVAREALQEEFGVAPVMMGCGGSIPIVETFKTDLGMDTLLVGFALDDDRIHSPNEKYNVSSFGHGVGAWIRILSKLGGLESVA